MDENQVKEIAAKVCHEKMKNLYDIVRKEVKAEILYEMRSGGIRIEEFFEGEEYKLFKTRLESECNMHVSGVLRKFYEKMMNTLKF